MRILALDWGTVRLGVAISDPDGKIAFPFEQPIDAKSAVSEVKRIVDEKEIDIVVIGLPRSMAGNDTNSTKSVEQFVSKLKEQIPCPIKLLDERLSSVGAHKTLTNQGLNQKQQKGLVDNLVAQQMLQAFLDQAEK